MNTKEVVNQLITKSNVTMIQNVKIKKATVTVLPEYTRVALTLDKEVDRFVPNMDEDGNQDGTYVMSKTNVVFTSSFALAGILMDTENAFAANTLVESPKGFEVILSGAATDLVLEHIDAEHIEEDYVNPFSNTVRATKFAHPTSICHPFNLRLSEFGNKMTEKLAEKMLGF